MSHLCDVLGVSCAFQAFLLALSALHLLSCVEPLSLPSLHLVVLSPHLLDLCDPSLYAQQASTLFRVYLSPLIRVAFFSSLRELSLHLPF